MIVALVFFAVAAVGGVALAFLRFTNKKLPMPLALVHGLVAAVGLVLLALAVVSSGASGGALIALVVFLVAALGGFFLFSLHMRQKELPLSIVAIHGLVAVVAFVVLLVAATQGA